uniref:Uncharacterized protein n=1 Tax=Octopus bimaculoides TaxID=37653 RepID=A0A0L8I5Y8_OCTBM
MTQVAAALCSIGRGIWEYVKLGDFYFCTSLGVQLSLLWRALQMNCIKRRFKKKKKKQVINHLALPTVQVG